MLTPEQKAVLAAHIAASPDLSVYPNNSDGAFAIAALLNEEASPAFYLWRSAYTPEEMRAAIINGITQLDALTGSKRDSLLWLVQGEVDASLASTRAAFNDLTGSQNTLKAAVLDGAKRTASRAEKLFATGTGSFADPAVAGWEGSLTYQEVQDARGA